MVSVASTLHSCPQGPLLRAAQESQAAERLTETTALGEQVFHVLLTAESLASETVLGV